MAAELVPAPEPEPGDAPEPFMTATCAFYLRPNGSVVAAYRTSDGQEGRKVVPRAIVAMWKRKLEVQIQAQMNGQVNGLAD